MPRPLPAAVRQLLRESLEECGYTVLEAENGTVGLDVARRWDGPIDLLITDVVMPEMSGFALAESLGREYPGMGVIYMSGYTDDAIVRHGVLDPGIVFLQKPCVVDAPCSTPRYAPNMAGNR